MAIASKCQFTLQLPRSSNDHVITAFSPDGKYLLTAQCCHFARKAESEDKFDVGHACLWNVNSGKRHSPLTLHRGGINCISFHVDGTLYLTGGNDQQLCVHETATGEIIRVIQCKSMVCSAVFSPSSEDVTVATSNAAVSRFDGCRWKELYRGHSRSKNLVWMIAQSDLIAVVSGLQVIVISSVTGAIVRILKHRLRVTALSWIDDSRLLTSSDDYWVREWTVTNSDVREVYQNQRWIWSLEASEDKKRFLIGTEDNVLGGDHQGHARIIDLKSGNPVSEKMMHKGTVLTCMVPSKKQLVTVSSDRTCALWDSVSGMRLMYWPLKYCAEQLAVSPNGDYFAVSVHRSAILFKLR